MYWAAAIAPCSIAEITHVCDSRSAVTVITKFTWIAIVACHLIAFGARRDYTAFATEQLLTDLTNIIFATALSAKEIHAFIACKFLQAILIHPILYFATPADVPNTLRIVENNSTIYPSSG